MLKAAPFQLLFIAILISSQPAWAETSAGSGDEGVQPLRGGMVQFGGELELEVVKSESNDQAGNNPNARMKIDKIVLTTKVKFSDRITFQADIESVPDKPIKVDEAWVKFKGLPMHSWIKFGLEDIFMKPHRLTESYPILGHAFWQDEDLGVYLGGELGAFYWRASATNGRRLKDRKIQEDNVYPITTDDDDNVDKNGNKQIGVGLGLNLPIGESHRIDILPFFYTATLSEADLDYLLGRNDEVGIANYTGTADDDSQQRYGLNFEFIAGGATIFAQVMQATDGKMDRDGWYVQPSYKLKFKNRTSFNAVEFLVRYEDYNVDLDIESADSRTWDRQTITVAVITDIAKNLKVKTEYYFNDEETGNGSFDNNELLMQLEAKF